MGEAMDKYATALRRVMHRRFLVGQGTRDMQGPEGLTTEAFIDCVADRLHRVLNDLPRFGSLVDPEEPVLTKPDRRNRRNYDLDMKLVKEMFDKYDVNGDGTIAFDEFEEMIHDLGIGPKKDLQKAKGLDRV